MARRAPWWATGHRSAECVEPMGTGAQAREPNTRDSILSCALFLPLGVRRTATSVGMRGLEQFGLCRARRDWAALGLEAGTCWTFLAQAVRSTTSGESDEMEESAQVRLYPLGQSDLRPAIEATCMALRARDWDYRAGSMSTLLAGQAEPVFTALRDAFQAAASHGSTVMVITLSNACSPLPLRGE